MNQTTVQGPRLADMAPATPMHSPDQQLSPCGPAYNEKDLFMDKHVRFEDCNTNPDLWKTSGLVDMAHGGKVGSRTSASDSKRDAELRP